MPVTSIRDLSQLFGDARDQGARPTCLAFAASDHHAALRDGWTPLSCEFAFYHAQRRGGRGPGVGAALCDMLTAIREDGQPPEAVWPYTPAPITDLNAWGPPAGPAPLYRRDGERRNDTFELILALIDGGQPALILMMLSDAFYQPNADGVVSPAVGDPPDPKRRHAVVAVAHGLLGEERAVLVRNSWGTDWGLAGHAWLTESFLVPRLTRIAVLTEEVDVPARRAAA